MSSNPGTGYWMDNSITFICLKNFTAEIKWKRGSTLFTKKVLQIIFYKHFLPSILAKFLTPEAEIQSACCSVNSTSSGCPWLRQTLLDPDSGWRSVQGWGPSLSPSSRRCLTPDHGSCFEQRQEMPSPEAFSPAPGSTSSGSLSGSGSWVTSPDPGNSVAKMWRHFRSVSTSWASSWRMHCPAKTWSGCWTDPAGWSAWVASAEQPE